MKRVKRKPVVEDDLVEELDNVVDALKRVSLVTEPPAVESKDTPTTAVDESAKTTDSSSSTNSSEGGTPELTANKEGKKGVKKGGGVRFRADEEVHVYDQHDPPSFGIHDVASAPEPEQVFNPQPRVPFVEAPLKVEKSAEVQQSFHLSSIQGKVRATFDTDTMTVAELKEALSMRGLPTTGKKPELKQRLEDDIVKESKSRKSKKGSKTKGKAKKTSEDEVPDWLHW
ncbi:hypothetical protein Pelo_13833 [Pelomyxa schiedti]|nr:hypothetical protein Pelo_13833 [Pelomyxa schiedti]